MRVTLHIDTETDVYDDVVEVLNAAFGMEWVGPEPAYALDVPSGCLHGCIADESSVIVRGWSPRKLRQWAQWLRDDAKEIVRIVAAEPPGAHFDEVREHMGRYWGLPVKASGQAVGGCMSSGGHAAASIPEVDGQPIDRDYARRLYVIDPRVAEVLADELGPPSN